MANFAVAAVKLAALVETVSPATKLLLPRMPLAFLYGQKGIDDAREERKTGFDECFKVLLTDAVAVGAKTSKEDLVFDLFDRKREGFERLVRDLVHSVPEFKAEQKRRAAEDLERMAELAPKAPIELFYYPRGAKPYFLWLQRVPW